jgi:alpha-glucosidase
MFLSAMSAFAQQLRPLQSGLTAMTDGVTLQVTALRDDVLRVREWKGGNAPGDASWAVLPSSHDSSVPVTAEDHGFKTKVLRVVVDDQLRLTVADLAVCGKR